MHGVAYRAVTRQHPFNRIQQVFGETGFEQDFLGERERMPGEIAAGKARVISTSCASGNQKFRS